MAYYVNAYTVTVNTIGGASVTFTDGADTPGAGASANAALEGHQDIKGLGVVGEAAEASNVFIPFHAVDNAVITFSRTTGEKPADTTCVED